MSRHAPSSAYVALTTAAVVWGGSVVAQKVALGPFSAVEVSVFRGLGALGILIPFLVVAGKARRFFFSS